MYKEEYLPLKGKLRPILGKRFPPNFQFDKGGDCMKLKHKIVIEILLVMAAIAVFIYNFSMQREIAYIASIVAVCGTIALLIKDIVKWKKNK